MYENAFPAIETFVLKRMKAEFNQRSRNNIENRINYTASVYRPGDPGLGENLTSPISQSILMLPFLCRTFSFQTFSFPRNLSYFEIKRNQHRPGSLVSMHEFRLLQRSSRTCREAKYPQLEKQNLFLLFWRQNKKLGKYS